LRCRLREHPNTTRSHSRVAHPNVGETCPLICTHRKENKSEAPTLVSTKMQTLDGPLTSGAQIFLKFFSMQFKLNPGDMNHEKPFYPHSPVHRWQLRASKTVFHCGAVHSRGCSGLVFLVLGGRTRPGLTPPLLRATRSSFPGLPQT